MFRCGRYIFNFTSFSCLTYQDLITRIYVLQYRYIDGQDILRTFKNALAKKWSRCKKVFFQNVTIQLFDWQVCFLWKFRHFSVHWIITCPYSPPVHRQLCHSSPLYLNTTQMSAKLMPLSCVQKASVKRFLWQYLCPEIIISIGTENITCSIEQAWRKIDCTTSDCTRKYERASRFLRPALGTLFMAD